MQQLSCLEALFPETRRILLGSLLSSADRQWYFAELAEALGKSPSSLQRELKSLVRIGLLNRRVIGKKVYFQANVRSPFFTVLRDVFAIQTKIERAA